MEKTMEFRRLIEGISIARSGDDADNSFGGARRRAEVAGFVSFTVKRKLWFPKDAPLTQLSPFANVAAR